MTAGCKVCIGGYVCTEHETPACGCDADHLCAYHEGWHDALDGPEVERLRALACALEERCEIAERDADRLAGQLGAWKIWGAFPTAVQALPMHVAALEARRP